MTAAAPSKAPEATPEAAAAERQRVPLPFGGPEGLQEHPPAKKRA